MKKSNAKKNQNHQVGRSYYAKSLKLTGDELVEIARLVEAHVGATGLAVFLNQTHNDGITLSLQASEGINRAFTIRKDRHTNGL